MSNDDKACNKKSARDIAKTINNDIETINSS